MLVARVFLVAVLLRATFTSEEKNHSHLSRVLRLSDEEEPEYFEQCRFVNIWKEQLGRVSVLAFLDPAWLYSYRQAVMLQLLSSRLRKSGFTDIRFFVITPPPDLMEDKSENEIEIEAWREIAAMPETRHIFVNAKDQLLKDDGPEMIYLQDGPRFRMWKRFRASKNQVVVIDRCGKLTYQVIVPWSILYFPYVKAAILSTYQEDPCGGCDPTVHRSLNDKKYSLNLTNNTTKETDSRETGDVNTPVWTTERLEKFTVQLNESLEEDREATIASPIIIDEVTDIDRSDRLTESSVKYEAICQYNSATNPDTEETQNQEQSINWSRDDSTISSETATTIDLQEESPYTPISIEDNTVTASYADTKDRTLLSDEPIDRIGEIKTSLSPTPETTISDAEVSDDEARDNGERIMLKENAPPLHIIMHAPHVHRNGKKTKKHAYLILKTNDPEFHGHLDSEIDVIPPSNSQSDADFQTSTEEYDWEAIKADTDEKDTRHQKYIFDKDESPGLYGEVADYWKSFEDSDIIDRNETTNDNSNDTTITYQEEHRPDISDHMMKLSKSSEIDESYPNLADDISIKNSTNLQNIVKLEKTGSSKPNIVNNQVEREEEGRIKLIEHYSKLLSWIDYRLNK